MTSSIWNSEGESSMFFRSLYIKERNREGVGYQLLNLVNFELHKIKNLKNLLTRDRKISTYFRNYATRKIHFGCGDVKLSGFLNTDILGEIPVDITKKLPFRSDSTDLIYSNHLVEHIYNWQFKKFLKESHRVLKKGGIHIIGTPSLQKIASILYSLNEEDKKKFELLKKRHSEDMINENDIDPATFINHIMHINYAHHFLHDEESIRKLAYRAGYSNIKKIDNFAVPDDMIAKSLESRRISWDFETETFILYK